MPEMSDALKALVITAAVFGAGIISACVWMIGAVLAEANHARRERKRIGHMIDDSNCGAPEGGVKRRPF